MRNVIALLVFVLCTLSPLRADEADPLARWRDGVVIRPVAPDAPRHTIHAYYVTCPESPDGRNVLYFSSITPDAHRGDVVVLDRQSRQERILASDIACEDAHRAACQEWVAKGHSVAFHGERNGVWSVCAVDLASGQERLLAEDRLKGFSHPDGDVVPVYGKHWSPGQYHDLQLVNVRTGAITTPLTLEQVRQDAPNFFQNHFPDRETSLFFPVLSPDQRRVFFKMSSPGSVNSPYSSAASRREGLFCYSLDEPRLLFVKGDWGHPSWFPDSRTIVQLGNTLIDSNDGTQRRIPGWPIFRGDHPSASPDGQLIVTDTTLDRLGGDAREWGVIVGDIRGQDYIVLHRFDNSRGARSWRRSHPHPVFSPDGRRIYFNVSSDDWTRLYVAEAPDR